MGVHVTAYSHFYTVTKIYQQNKLKSLNPVKPLTLATFGVYDFAYQMISEKVLLFFKNPRINNCIMAKELRLTVNGQ